MRVRISLDIFWMTSRLHKKRPHETKIVIAYNLSKIFLPSRSNNDSAFKFTKIPKHMVFTIALNMSAFAHKSKGKWHPDFRLYTN